MEYSTGQLLFFDLLSRFPRLECYWDQGTCRHDCKLEVAALKKALRVMSSGECHLARFFASVWCGSNTEWKFDFIGATGSLDTAGLEAIREWLDNPFWP